MRIIPMIFILLAVFGCKKEALPFTFTGKVTDRAGNPVAQATVELAAYYNASNASTPGGLSSLATTKTNNEGVFTVPFNQSSGIRDYEVRVFANEYFPFRVERFDTLTLQNNTLTYNPSIYKQASIRIAFKNVSPASNLDEFHVNQENELFGGRFDTFVDRQFTGGTFDDLEHKYIGAAIQGYEVTKTKGDTFTYINWTSKKNGVLSYTRDSVFIASGAQGNYAVNY